MACELPKLNSVVDEVGALSGRNYVANSGTRGAAVGADGSLTPKRYDLSSPSRSVGEIAC